MLTRNLHLKAAALALAVFLWFWVLLKEQNLIPEHTAKVGIAAEGVQQGLALPAPLPEAEVRLRGLKEELDDAGRSAEAYVSCRGLGPGTHRRTVSVRAPSKVTVMGVRPSEVSVVLEEVVSEARPVDLRLVGEPQAGYQLLGSEVSPRVVQVSGPRSAVERATRAVATMDLGRAMPEVPASLLVQVLDSEGRPAEGVDVRPARVNALASLKLVIASRTVPVVVRAQGGPPADFRIAAVQVQPAMVTIAGPANKVADVKQIETQDLVLSNVTSSFTRTLALVVPEEVSLYSDPSVTVTVRVEKAHSTAAMPEPGPEETGAN